MSSAATVMSCDRATFEAVTAVDGALLVPGGRRGPATVVDPSGAPVVDAGGFQRDRYVPAGFFDPRRAPDAERLTGSYLFGGVLWPHFGHFIFESITRLWACDAMAEPPAGLLFFAPRRSAERLSPMQRDILDLLGIRTPVLVVTKPTLAERLLVPRQGCGMGPLSAGTPAFRQFLRGRLSRLAPRTDAPSIYISRSGYRLRRGGFLAEEDVETWLAAEGYTIFAPERHSIGEQVSTYLGAERIVSPDSSALHLAAYAARPETRMAIILRRRDGAKDLLPQIAGFTGRAPLVIDSIEAILRRDNERNPTWATVAELDLAKLARHLRAGGFLRDGARWPPLAPGRRHDLLAACEARLGGRFVPVWPEPGAVPAGEAALSPSLPPENSL